MGQASIEIRNVLCPTDQSEPARRAFEHAVAVARWYAARVTVLQVVPPPVPLAVGLAPAVPPLPPRGAEPEAALELLEAFVAPARRSPLDLMLYGSTTQHVVREAGCPVLVVPAAREARLLAASRVESA